MNTNRLYSLDYLRGLSALGIVIYHYITWAYGPPDPNTFMGKFGVYGVGIFYILSGLTLYLVYSNKMIPDANDLKEFYLKRFFRIFPLLWLTIILTLILNGIVPGVKNLIINLTGLFGLLRWDAYIGTGVWSIGNELVFYLFFPVFVFLNKNSLFLFYLLCAVIFSVSMYFAFAKFDPHQPLSVQSQWSMYVNPLNQVFLFLSGYLMGVFGSKIKVSNRMIAVIFMLSFLLFCFYPVITENLSASINRVVLSLASFFICFSFYKSSVRYPGFLHKGFVLLGEGSYSLYLLHPIVWLICLKVVPNGGSVPKPLQLVTIVFFALGISYLNYKYFEVFFMNLGKDIIKKVIKAPKKVKPKQDASEIAAV